MLISKELEFHHCCCKGCYEEPSICPICGNGIKPQEFAFLPFQNLNNEWFLSGFYLCTSCFQTFVTLHKCHVEDVCYKYTSSLIYAEPKRFQGHPFDERISTLSPQFVKIYNQALAAEASGLDEIAGLGFRKALEFLVKDFCTHIAPDKSDQIQKCALMKCVSDYIQNEKIKTLASRSAWIGNDEAHYLRKLGGRDVSDMKSFLMALVYYVSMELLVEDASSILPVRSPDSAEKETSK